MGEPQGWSNGVMGMEQWGIGEPQGYRGWSNGVTEMEGME